MNTEDVEVVIRDGLSSMQLLQLATAGDAGPWICTVHFVADDDLNIYWLSLPSRRHSQELVANSNVAVTVAVKYEMPVIGIQAEGQASEVTDSEVIKNIMEKYVEKFNIGRTFYENFIAGNNKHKLYKFTPRRFSLFDEVNFKQSSPVEFIVEKG